MMSSSIPYTVTKPPSAWPAILLALLVHAVLFAFLWVGINWVNNTPETIEVESWSPKELEQAPPPPVQPPPPEVVKPQPKVEEKPEVEKPDIALEQDKKRKALEKEKKAREEEEEKKQEAAQKKKEEEDKQKLADEKRKQDQLDKKNLEKQRQEELKRITGEATKSDASGTASRSQGNSSNSAWVSKVTAKVKSNIVGVSITSSENNDPVEYVVGLLPDGSVAGIRKTKSSGIPTFDDAVKRAIEASQPYPADSSGRVPSSFISKNYPKDQ